MIKLIFLLSVFLLFFNLGKPLIWQDEAEVALLARNITKFGLPVAWDGETLITQSEGQDSKYVGHLRLWSWNTWLPHYAAALSFKLFGETTTAARLPFALAGFGVILFSYLLAKKLSIDPRISLLVISTSTLFYLYSRQARYYSFSMLFPLSAYYFYLSRRNFMYFLSLLASFHSNFVLSFGLTLPSMLFGLKNKYTWVFLLQSFAWAWFFHPPGNYWIGLPEISLRFLSYLNIVNSFFFPLVFFPIIFFIKRLPLFAKLLLAGIFTHIAAISFSLPLAQRYLVPLIPVFALFLALVLSKLGRPKLILLILPIVMFTNLPNIFSERIIHPSYFLKKPKIRFFFFDYISSLTKDYPGPIEGQVTYLTSEKIPDKSVLIFSDYETNSLRFYFPNLHFVDHPSADVTYWLPRSSWGNLNELTSCQKEEVKKTGQKIILPNFDTQWGNMPDITYHQFKIDPATPRLAIYKTLNGVNWDKCT